MAFLLSGGYDQQGGSSAYVVQELEKWQKLLAGGQNHEEALKSKYSRFDQEGMPTHDANGSELADKVGLLRHTPYCRRHAL